MGIVWIEFSGAGSTNKGLQNQCLPRLEVKLNLTVIWLRQNADVMVDDFQAIVAKLRESYKNLNVDNVGVFGQGLG